MFRDLLVVGERQLSGWSVFLKGNWHTDTFVTNYLPMAIMPVLYIGHKLWTRGRVVSYGEMDFKTGLQEALDSRYVLSSIAHFLQWCSLMPAPIVLTILHLETGLRVCGQFW